ncbi:hypothetical protein BDL97_15G067500 [Sphagnum fallax]|nr:hypothetical protein BDL97_15G067500 [Sphagnum fallax]
MSIIPKGGTLRIREVWAENLEDELELIRDIVDDYPYLAMDTEFPGVVFNFREFNLREDVYAQDSIELLQQSGIDFKKNEERGIDSQQFAELLMSSGVVLNDNVHWITFHSGYDFGYLLKLLTCQNLPSREQDFFVLLRTYFPSLYDVKYLMKFCHNLHGGLNRLAEQLEVDRYGPSHQAGSDSLLTSCTFRKLKEGYFDGSTGKYAGVLYGLGVDNSES